MANDKLNILIESEINKILESKKIKKPEIFALKIVEKIYDDVIEYLDKPRFKIRVIEKDEPELVEDPMSVIPNYEIPVARKTSIYIPEQPEELTCLANKWSPKGQSIRCDRYKPMEKKYCMIHQDYRPFGCVA